MIHTLAELVRGNPKIVTFYEKAVRLWESLLTREGGRDPDKLAKFLTEAQDEFEIELELDRRLAQEILAVAGIARYYDSGPGFRGNEGNLFLVRLAIERSACSTEVKDAAEELAKLYDLDPLPRTNN